MKSKTFIRLQVMSSNVLRQVLVSLFGMLVPFIAIHFYSKEIWVGFVPMLTYILFVMVLINWGNKEYLLRYFSTHPGKIEKSFSSSLATRFPSVLLFSCLALFVFQIDYGFYIFLWLLGRYFTHSVEPLLFFEKKFKSFLQIEIISFLLFYAAVVLDRHQSYHWNFLAIYSLYQSGKGAVSLYIFRHFINIRHFRFDFSLYKKSFTLFALTAFGFLISKADIYLVQFFCNPVDTADYQILNGLLLFIASFSVFIYTPFTKNIYRNNEVTLDKYQHILAVIGLIIVPVALFFYHLVILYYLKLEMSVWFYILAFVYVYPSYLYGIQIVNKLRANKEHIVILYLFCGAVTTIIFSGLFLWLGYGIIGALSGSCVAQLMALYLFYIKDLKKNAA